MNSQLSPEIVTLENSFLYEDFFQKSKYENLFQSSRWGELKAKSGWVPFRYLFREPNSGPIVASVLLLKKKIPFFNLSILYAPRGPLLDFENDKLCLAVFDSLKEIAKDHRAILLKLNPNVPLSYHFIGQMLKRLAGGITKNPSMHSITLRLSLLHSDEELQGLFDTRARTALRKSIKEGIQIEEVTDLKGLEIFFEILAATSQRKEFYVPSLSLIQQVHEVFVKEGFGKIFLARHEDDYLAGACFLRTAGECRYMWGGSVPKKRNSNPNHLIQWSAMKWARDHGCTAYDFQGVDRSKDDPKSTNGSYFFKSSFGGEEVKFVGEYDFVIRPMFYLLFLFFEPKFRTLMSFFHRIRRKGA